MTRIRAGHQKRAAKLKALTARRKRYPPLPHALSRERVLKSRYGITLAQYDEMLQSQEGRCAVCRALPKNRPLHVDHRHADGFIRGLLCFKCNISMAVIDNVELHEKLVIYSKRK